MTETQSQTGASVPKAKRPDYVVKLAQSESDVQAAQRLRYDVFVDELGAKCPSADHQARLEKDHFDPFFDHLLLLDTNLGSTVDAQIVGTYRVMRHDQAQRQGGFYSEDEYDLSALVGSGSRLVELGRSCVRKDYRGGMAMAKLWGAIAAYVEQHSIDILFGVVSFHGTDIERHGVPLSYLYHHHLAPAELRVTAKGDSAHPLNILAKDQVSKREAMLATPSLLKGYLRLGGYIGDGAFIDYDFNTVDVCMILKTEQITAQSLRYYTRTNANNLR